MDMEWTPPLNCHHLLMGQQTYTIINVYINKHNSEGDGYGIQAAIEPPLHPQGLENLYYYTFLCICEHNSEGDGDGYGVDNCQNIITS